MNIYVIFAAFLCDNLKKNTAANQYLNLSTVKNGGRGVLFRFLTKCILHLRTFLDFYVKEASLFKPLLHFEIVLKKDIF